MYVLEFRTTNRHHTWLRCAICETKAPLERVRQEQIMRLATSGKG